MQAFASNPQAGRDTAQMESDEVQMRRDEVQMDRGEAQMGGDEAQMGSDEAQMDCDELQMDGDDTRFPVRSLESGLALSEVEQVRLRRWFVPSLSDSPLQTIDSTVCDS